MTSPRNSGGSWLNLAMDAAAMATKAVTRLRAEYAAGRDGLPAPSGTAPGVASRPPAAAEPAWWQVLEVQPTAPPGEITAAYRERIAKNHPDKVAHLSDKLRQVAEQETQRINAAYEEAQRGAPPTN